MIKELKILMLMEKLELMIYFSNKLYQRKRYRKKPKIAKGINRRLFLKIKKREIK